MRSLFRQNCFKKCVFRIGGGSLQFDTTRFKIANFKKRSAKRLAFCIFIKKRTFLTWKRGAKLTLIHFLICCKGLFIFICCCCCYFGWFVGMILFELYFFFLWFGLLIILTIFCANFLLEGVKNRINRGPKIMWMGAN